MLDAKDIGLQKQEKRQGLTIQWSKFGLYGAFIIFTLVVIIPIYWMVRSSFATSADLHTSPLNYFPPFTFSNFTTLVQQVPFLPLVHY
jgi:ABC-type glycerol-3-phosphate transport system permease component